MAAGILLVEEAGGIIGELDGKPISISSRRVIATSRAIHAEFMRRARG